MVDDILPEFAVEGLLFGRSSMFLSMPSIEKEGVNNRVVKKEIEKRPLGPETFPLGLKVGLVLVRNITSIHVTVVFMNLLGNR